MTARTRDRQRRNPLLADPRLAEVHRQRMLHEETAVVLERRALAAPRAEAALLRQRADQRRLFAVRLGVYLADATSRARRGWAGPAEDPDRPPRR